MSDTIQFDPAQGPTQSTALPCAADALQSLHARAPAWGLPGIRSVCAVCCADVVWVFRRDRWSLVDRDERGRYRVHGCGYRDRRAAAGQPEKSNEEG